ncbi:MAG: ATP-binding protein [Sphingobacteriaceae bacterium]|nr:ATP-binding protein [Sphingobacteriaceae bacterium]
MNFIHYTKAFEKAVDESKKQHIYKKIAELRFIDKPELLNSIDSYTKGILVLKFHGALTCRIIIQSEWIEINDDRVHVLFVRDFISKKGFDYFWGSVTHPILRSGDWLSQNPLPNEEMTLFKKEYIAAFKLNDKKKLPLPTDLTKWLSDFKISLNFDIYEREAWVLYSNNRSIDGLQEKHVIFFRDTLRAILEPNKNSKVIQNLLDQDEQIYSAIYEPFNVGIIYSQFNDAGGRKIILYDGAHLKEQKERWEKAISNLSKEGGKVKGDVLNISKDAFRAYPKWIVTNDNDELWFAIQRFDGSNNLSLLPEQVHFLNNFEFPAYINGQAGSGKSTMLYYLFANVYFYKCAGQVSGDIIFLTENDKLLEHTCKSIIGLLSNNPEFNAGLSIEERNNIRNHFSSFRSFLMGILPDDVRQQFGDEKYLDFAKFKDKFNARFINRKHSAEEVWFVISTYVYGYFEFNNINTVAKYTDEVNGIPSKFRIVSPDNFDQIVTNYLSFYDKLIEDGWWDKITIVRKIREYFPGPIPKQYTVVFCDEAQDFSRIELRLIIQSSEFIKYDLTEINQVPIVFAGDALQTVSPTGFSDTRLHQMYYEAFEDANFKYDKTRSTYNPEYNYRSLLPIVRLANIIQNFRKEALKEDVVIKQFAKRENLNASIPIAHSIEWLSSEGIRTKFEEKFKYKSFIVPVDLNEEVEYIKTQNLLFEKFVDIKSSIDAKGAEYSQVVVYGFADYYIKEFGELKWSTVEYDFKKKFFFNKLYVAITRAQNELIVIDSDNGCEKFWKPLLNIPTQVKRWEEYQDINEVLPIKPETGLQNIQDSSPDEALQNAKVDMEQGIIDKNVARLIVASNVFLMLGKVEEANSCLGHKEIIKGNWDAAGSHFVKAKNLKEASKAFFNGKNWGQLLNSPTKTLSGHKQELRVLIAHLMKDVKIDRSALTKLYDLRHVLHDVLRDINWFPELIKTLKSTVSNITSLETKREFALILESIAREHDLDLWEVIGELYFETKQFKFAIEAWGRKINALEIPQYPQKYILAHIERSKDEANVYDELLWCGRFIFQSNDHNEKISYSKRIQTINSDTDFKISTSEIQLELLQSILVAHIIIGNTHEVIELSKEVESRISNTARVDYYAYCLSNCSSNEIAVFLKERWAKGMWLNQPKTSIDEYILKLNEEFKRNNFPFKDSNFDWTKEELALLSDVPVQFSIDPADHLRNIQVIAFRKFENIEIQNVGQFNLILGDNNSGKTTILEALLFSSNPDQCIFNFLYAKRQRNNNAEKNSDYQLIESLINRKSKDIGLGFNFKEGRRYWSYKLRYPTLKELFAKYEVEKLDPKNYLAIETGAGNVYLSESIQEMEKYFSDPQKLSKIPYVPFGKGYFDKLASIYHSEIGSKRGLRGDFIEQMKTFIPEIVDISIDPETDTIKIEEEINGVDYGSSLNDFGEGANKLFRILVQLHASKGKRLMIDEIDAGIHYSRFKEFWKVILSTAKEYDVQIFCTTHNDECIKYFWEVLQESQFECCREKSRTITFELHTKTDAIVPIVRDYENMLYSDEHGLEVRGGKI